MLRENEDILQDVEKKARGNECAEGSAILSTLK